MARQVNFRYDEDFIYDLDKRRTYRLTAITSEENDLTIVTAFFDIGGPYHPADYRRWFTGFSLIANPLVVFVDTDYNYEYVQTVRRRLPVNKTRIVKLRRRDVKSYWLKWRIAQVQQMSSKEQKSYRNVQAAQYLAAMHAKYEVLRLAVRDNPFESRYFCWADFDRFRDESSWWTYLWYPSVPPPTGRRPTCLHLPSNFADYDYAGSIVFEPVLKRRCDNCSASEIVRRRLVWISGRQFLGGRWAMLTWTADYAAAVESMLAKNLTGGEEQIIYAMINEKMTSIQPKFFNGTLRL